MIRAMRDGENRAPNRLQQYDPRHFMMTTCSCSFSFGLIPLGAQTKPAADLIVNNANVYTVDTQHSDRPPHIPDPPFSSHLNVKSSSGMALTRRSSMELLFPVLTTLTSTVVMGGSHRMCFIESMRPVCKSSFRRGQRPRSAKTPGVWAPGAIGTKPADALANLPRQPKNWIDAIRRYTGLRGAVTIWTRVASESGGVVLSRTGPPVLPDAPGSQRATSRKSGWRPKDVATDLVYVNYFDLLPRPV